MNPAREDSECCGMCGRFKRRDAEQASRGYAWCLGYGRYVHAASAPTVLFVPPPANEMEERRAFLEKHQEAA